MALGFYESYFLLKPHVNPNALVHIMDFQYNSDYTTVVELLKISITLDQYFTLNPRSTDPLFLELMTFLESFDDIYSIDDFLPMQIGYVNHRGWVLFDYGSGVEFKTNKYVEYTWNNIVYDWKFFINDKIYKLINDTLN